MTKILLPDSMDKENHTHIMPMMPHDYAKQLPPTSNKWYRWMISRLMNSDHRLPRLREEDDSAFSRSDMLTLLARVSPAQTRLIPLSVAHNHIADFSDVLGCLVGLGKDCHSDVFRAHLQVCRIGYHWAVVLVQRCQVRGVLCMYVYHPGQVCKYDEVENVDGEMVNLYIYGSRYQSDDDRDECAPFAVWGSLYVANFVSKHHGMPPSHVPWFKNKKRFGVRQVLGACKTYLESVC